MRVAVASGKGGTGKTMVATNLAWLLAERGCEVTYVDADVEAPNGHLFLSPEITGRRKVTVTVPEIKGPGCTGCGECQRFCAFNAILAFGDEPVVFPELCHDCGGCQMVCPERVLGERALEVGELREGRAGQLGFLGGLLEVGQPRSTPVIDAVMAHAPRRGLVVVDAPPGTSCQAVAALRGADRVVLVTEPTPFGLHDLRAADSLCRQLNLPALVVINRCDTGNDEILAQIRAEVAFVAAEIPFDLELAHAGATGELAVTSHQVLSGALTALADGLGAWVWKEVVA